MNNQQSDAVAAMPIATLAMVNLDCEDPAALAAFYAVALQGEITHSSADYAMIRAGGTVIGFGRVPGYRAPQWPDETGSKRYHLDLQAETSLAAAEDALARLGAGVPRFQPGGDRWRVLTDPAGHPFCISAKQANE